MPIFVLMHGRKLGPLDEGKSRQRDKIALS
jgi:hypothetical protein